MIITEKRRVGTKEHLNLICHTFKVLVEQGDPIPATGGRKVNIMRIALSFFSLVSIVLSNAYKNENIIRLTVPLAPIP